MGSLYLFIIIPGVTKTGHPREGLTARHSPSVMQGPTSNSKARATRTTTIERVWISSVFHVRLIISILHINFLYLLKRVKNKYEVRMHKIKKMWEPNSEFNSWYTGSAIFTFGLIKWKITSIRLAGETDLIRPRMWFSVCVC